MRARGAPAVFYRLARPLLFSLEPERAHALTLALSRVVGSVAPLRAAVRAFLRVPAERPAEVWGQRFPNVVGLAAGFDKDGLAWRGLGCLGFGHVEIGTVTPRPQTGNPRPRVFRLADERSLINRLGFPSRGADFVAARLRGGRRPGDPRLGINIGKQRETPLDGAVSDYLELVTRFAPLADYLTINISSPNTPSLRELQGPSRLLPLLRALVERRDEVVGGDGRVPLLVKLSPDLEDRDLEDTLGAIEAAGVDGIVATNTTTGRAGVASALGGEQGGLSGAALAARSTEVVRNLHRLTEGRLPIVACGGVAGPADARAKLEAGAALVQLYTGLVYEGPGLVGAILRGL